MKKNLLLVLFSIVFVFSSFGLDRINISIVRPDRAPYFIGIPEMNIDAEEFNTLIIKLRSAKRETIRLYWASNLDPQMNEPKSISFNVKRSEGLKEYTFNLRAQNSYWAGFIGQFIFYPDGGIDGISIETSSAIIGTPSTNIRSAWIEFWGLRGRATIGSTVNVIKSINIMGKPVNLIALWILLILSICLIINKLKSSFTGEKGDSSANWVKIGKKTALAAIIIWAILEVNVTYNYLNDIFRDYADYYGKTPEQKIKQSLGDGQYNFYAFCKNVLPKNGTNVGIVYPETMGPIELKLRYYFYPIRIEENPKPDDNSEYILVYQGNPNQYLNNGKYYLFAKYKEGEIILKRK